MGRRAQLLLVAWILAVYNLPALALDDVPAGPHPAPGWPVIVGNGIHATPAVFDFDGDARAEIVVTVRDGRVFLLDGHGASLPGWPQSTANGISTSAVVGDVDGDGSPEIVAASRDGRVHAWRVDGSRLARWPVDVGSVAVSAPVPVFGASGGILLATSDGRVHLLDPRGRPRPGWPRRSAPRRATHHEQVTTRTLDMDGDGNGEIVHLDGDGTVHVWRVDGGRFPGFPVALGEPGVGLARGSHQEAPIVCTTSQHVAVIDGEGRIRRRLAVNGDRFTSPPTVFSALLRPPGLPLIAAATQSGSIHVWWLDGRPVEGWPVRLSGFIYGIATEDERFAVYGAPVVWDVDHDAALEIIVGCYDQHLYAFELDAQPVAAWPLTLDDAIVSRPCFADLDGDTHKEMIVGQVGETLFAYRLGEHGPPAATLRSAAGGASREWPPVYWAVACAVLGLLVLLVVRLRLYLPAYRIHVGSRGRAWKAAGIVLVLLLIVRLSLFVNEIERYRHATNQLDTSRMIVASLIDEERGVLERKADHFAAQLEACDWREPHNPIRLLYEMERLTDRVRVDYDALGLMVSDGAGQVVQAVGAIQPYTRVPVPLAPGAGTTVSVVVLGDEPGFLVTRPLGGEVHGQWLHVWSTFAGDFPQRLADATGVDVVIKLDGKPVAWGGTSSRPSRSGWPRLGVVKPGSEFPLSDQRPVSIHLMMESYRALPTGWLDLTILLLLPSLLYVGNLESVESRLPRRFTWWLPVAVGIYCAGWLLLSGRIWAHRPVPLAGHGLGLLLHLLGLAAIGYALPRVVRPEIGKQLRFVLLVSYLFVGLLPLAVGLVIATRSLQEAQRQVAREAIDALEERADNLLLAYIGNHSFEGELHRAAQRMASRSMEGGWFDFVATTQYLFTYDLPSAYLTLSAHDRENPDQRFTGYSWRAPRSQKLYEPRPQWADSDPTRGLFLTRGSAIVQAMRTFRSRQIEATLVSHIPLDATVLSELEDRLRILPFLPRVKLEPAWVESSSPGSQRAQIPLPLSTDLALPARDWGSGAPRWVEYRAAASLPIDEELGGIVAALTLFILLPLGLSVWGAFFAYQRTARPLEHLLLGLRKVEAGDLDYRLGARGQTEIAAGAQAFDRMVSSLKRTVGTLAEKKKLEEISALKSRFISMVSHDLKTPLASIQGATENILGELAGPVSAKQRTYLEMILSSSSMLQQIISDLLDLSRIESGHLALEPETLDMRREVDEAIRSMRALLEERLLEVKVAQSVDPALVRADGIRLWQILNNILSNAVRHSPRGGTLRIRIEPDTLASNGGSTAIRTSVFDEGPGIPPETIGHVFEPFFYRPRGDGDRQAGLGLAIVKQMVELHGGHVAISSADTGGTCLSFSLLAAPPREVARAESAHQGANPARLRS